MLLAKTSNLQSVCCKWGGPKQRNSWGKTGGGGVDARADSLLQESFFWLRLLQALGAFGVRAGRALVADDEHASALAAVLGVGRHDGKGRGDGGGIGLVERDGVPSFVFGWRGRGLVLVWVARAKGRRRWLAIGLLRCHELASQAGRDVKRMRIICVYLLLQ